MDQIQLDNAHHPPVLEHHHKMYLLIQLFFYCHKGLEKYRVIHPQNLLEQMDINLFYLVLKKAQRLVQKNNILDLEAIFKLKPDLREDDKELVKFIFDNNGEVLESELRKKFLQPRTTMWRAVKRLEREGVIEIEKKDLQNLVKLRKDMEEDN